MLLRQADVRLKRLRAVDLRPVDFLPVDLRPVDLRAVDLRVDLRPVDLRPVDLRAVDLRPVERRPVDLRPVLLRAVDFRAVDLRPVDRLRPVVFLAANPSTSIPSPDEVNVDLISDPDARFDCPCSHFCTANTHVALNERCTNAHSRCYYARNTHLVQAFLLEIFSEGRSYEAARNRRALRSLRRRRLSRSEVPPQMPNCSLLLSAYSRHSKRTEH